MTSETIELRLNGDPTRLPAGTTLADLIESLGRHPRTVAVELNGRIVPRREYGEVVLDRDDRIEIVHFVQGG